MASQVAPSGERPVAVLNFPAVILMISTDPAPIPLDFESFWICGDTRPTNRRRLAVVRGRLRLQGCQEGCQRGLVFAIKNFYI